MRHASCARPRASEVEALPPGAGRATIQPDPVSLHLAPAPAILRPLPGLAITGRTGRKSCLIFPPGVADRENGMVIPGVPPCRRDRCRDPSGRDSRGEDD